MLALESWTFCQRKGMVVPDHWWIMVIWNRLVRFMCATRTCTKGYYSLNTNLHSISRKLIRGYWVKYVSGPLLHCDTGSSYHTIYAIKPRQRWLKDKRGVLWSLSSRDGGMLSPSKCFMYTTASIFIDYVKLWKLAQCYQKGISGCCRTQYYCWKPMAHAFEKLQLPKPTLNHSTHFKLRF